MANKQEYVEQLTRMTRRPSTPGDLLADLMESNNLTQGEVAARVKLSRVTINRIVQGHRPVTADVAHRLGRLFGGGPALWLNMQQQVELWDALHMDTSEFEQIEPLSKAA